MHVRPGHAACGQSLQELRILQTAVRALQAASVCSDCLLAASRQNKLSTGNAALPLEPLQSAQPHVPAVRIPAVRVPFRGRQAGRQGGWGAQALLEVHVMPTNVLCPPQSTSLACSNRQHKRAAHVGGRVRGAQSRLHECAEPKAGCMSTQSPKQRVRQQWHAPALATHAQALQSLQLIRNECQRVARQVEPSQGERLLKHMAQQAVQAHEGKQVVAGEAQCNCVDDHVGPGRMRRCLNRVLRVDVHQGRVSRPSRLCRFVQRICKQSRSLVSRCILASFQLLLVLVWHYLEMVRRILTW
jgi:hypothetical protein